jgi:hypothetical protein
LVHHFTIGFGLVKIEILFQGGEEGAVLNLVESTRGRKPHGKRKSRIMCA